MSKIFIIATVIAVLITIKDIIKDAIQELRWISKNPELQEKKIIKKILNNSFIQKLISDNEIIQKEGESIASDYQDMSSLSKM